MKFVKIEGKITNSATEALNHCLTQVKLQKLVDSTSLSPAPSGWFPALPGLVSSPNPLGLSRASGLEKLTMPWLPCPAWHIPLSLWPADMASIGAKFKSVSERACLVTDIILQKWATLVLPLWKYDFFQKKSCFKLTMTLTGTTFIHSVPSITNHRYPMLTQCTASSPRDAKLSQLDLVLFIICEKKMLIVLLLKGARV